jgi:three-Cys-motif partner protein
MEQKFGGAWTVIKLDVLESYLSFYTTAMKKQKFNCCYIDAFAGSGLVDVRGEGVISGSALRALDQPFQQYIFIEKDSAYADCLKRRIVEDFPHKNCWVIIGDCNEELQCLARFQWRKNSWRGVAFLDPYGLELDWNSLRALASTRTFDIWYLFPIMPLNRLLPRDGNIRDSHRLLIDRLLGTDDWEQRIYAPAPQLDFFDDRKVKVSTDLLRQYLIERLSSIFCAVSPNARILFHPDNNTPLYLLCFAMNNPNGAVLALKGANHILANP